MIPSRHVLVFEHIPKCAGSTIGSVLSREYKFHFGASSLVDLGLLNYYKEIINSLPCSVFISGHSCLAGYLEYDNMRSVTMLRDPFSRCISLYSFAKKQYMHDMSFEQFLSKYPNNFFTKWLGRGDLDQARRALDTRYMVVGVLERIQDFWTMLEKKMNIRLYKNTAFNITGKNNTEEYEPFRKMFRENNKLDYLLYGHAFSLACSESSECAYSPLEVQNDSEENQRYVAKKYDEIFLSSFYEDRERVRGVYDEELLAILTQHGEKIVDPEVRENVYIRKREWHKLLCLYISYGENAKASELWEAVEAIFKDAPKFDSMPIEEFGARYPSNLDYDKDIRAFRGLSHDIAYSGSVLGCGFKHLIIGSGIYTSIRTMRRLGFEALAESMLEEYQDVLGPVFSGCLDLEQALNAEDEEIIQSILLTLTEYAKNTNYLVSIVPAAVLFRVRGRHKDAIDLLKLQNKKDFFVYRVAVELAITLFEFNDPTGANELLKKYDCYIPRLHFNHTSLKNFQNKKVLIICSAPVLFSNLFLELMSTIGLHVVSVLVNLRHARMIDTSTLNFTLYNMPDGIFTYPDDIKCLDNDVLQENYDLSIVLGGEEVDWYGNMLELANHLTEGCVYFYSLSYLLSEKLRTQCVKVGVKKQ